MAEPVIRIRNLCTQFGQFVVHRNLDLEVRAGEIVSLVGGSGSGKTTLLRQMLGLEQPAYGTVQVLGEDINATGGARLRQLRRRWGVLFQHGALFSALTAFDNVAQPMRELRTLPEELIRDAALLKLDAMLLDPHVAHSEQFGEFAHTHPLRALDPVDDAQSLAFSDFDNEPLVHKKTLTPEAPERQTGQGKTGDRKSETGKGRTLARGSGPQAT